MYSLCESANEDRGKKKEKEERRKNCILAAPKYNDINEMSCNNTSVSAVPSSAIDYLSRPNVIQHLHYTSSDQTICIKRTSNDRALQDEHTKRVSKTKEW